MSYAKNGGVRIYYQVRGEGPPLVMLHGIWGSVEDWHDYGYVDGLEQAYRLILIDARGNGASDKPHDRDAYTTELMVADIVAVLDDLNVEKAHFMGYSFGGRFGFAIAKYAPERFHSLIIGGQEPHQFPPEAFERFIQLYREGMEAAVALIEEGLGRKMRPEGKARILANDVEALMARLEERRDEPGMEEVLPTMTMPCLVYMGEDDDLYPRAEEWVKQMPNVTFVSLPGLHHMTAFTRSDLVLPHVTRFLETVYKA